MRGNQLKPCPFCGAEADLEERRIYLDRGYQVSCSECGVHGPIVLVNHPKMRYGELDESTRYTNDQACSVAIRAWNTRHRATRKYQ